MNDPNDHNDHALFDIAMALHRHRELDALLAYIAGAVRKLVGVEGASVILIDEEANEFFFRVTAFDDPAAGDRMREIRYPVDKGIAGHVYKTGQPLVVQDTYASPYFLKTVDEEAGFVTRSMVDVPIRTPDRMIGVLCAVNKKGGAFLNSDVELMGAVANMVALPIENARITEALRQSLEDVRNMSDAMEEAIHSISHELKTPLAVLSGNTALLKKLLSGSDADETRRVLDRTERNLERLLRIQYDIEDMLRRRGGLIDE